MKYYCFLLLLAGSAFAAAQPVIKPRNALIYSPTTRYTPLLEQADAKSKELASAHRADSVDVLEYFGGPYCKVRIPPGQLATDGYLPIELFRYDSIMVVYVNQTSEKAGKTRRLKYEAPPQFIEIGQRLNHITGHHPRRRPLSQQAAQQVRTVQQVQAAIRVVRVLRRERSTLARVEANTTSIKTATRHT